MDQESMQRCSTCPAFAKLPGEGDAGTCRSAPPVALQAENYFRGSSRELPFGSLPRGRRVPAGHEDDYCMSHPGNRRS